MSSFVEPLELEDLDGNWEGQDPSVFDRVTAVPGEVPQTQKPPSIEEDPVSGLHEVGLETQPPPARVESEPAPPDSDPPAVFGAPASSAKRPRRRSSRPPRPPSAASLEQGRRGSSADAGIELELVDVSEPAARPAPERDVLEADLPTKPPPSGGFAEFGDAPELASFEPPSGEVIEFGDAPELASFEPPSGGFAELGEDPGLAGLEPEAAELGESAGDDPDLVAMTDRYATGDFSGALVIAEGILEAHPEHDEALRCRARCTDVLSQMYLARLGSLAQVVRVALASDQIRWLSLDHRAGFLLSLVDGTSSIEELLDISGMPRLDALRILYGLLDQRVIELASAP